MKQNIFFSSMLFLGICCFNATVIAETATTPQAANVSSVSEPTSTTTLPLPKWSSFDSAFQAGVASYQQKKYDEAREAFEQAVERQPDNVNALTNLALAQFQLSHKAMAVALLRKASDIDPHFSTTRSALKFILPQLTVREIPHEIQTWETLRADLLVPISLSGFLAMTALSFFATGWLFLQYFGRRRRAMTESTALPPFPLAATFIALVFVSMASLSVLKLIDQHISRGTIVEEKVSVYSAPDTQSVVLFDLYGGLEVLLDQAKNGWVQVTYPGGLTGWIPQSSVLPTSGRKLW